MGYKSYFPYNLSYQSAFIKLYELRMNPRRHPEGIPRRQTNFNVDDFCMHGRLDGRDNEIAPQLENELEKGVAIHFPWQPSVRPLVRQLTDSFIISTI